MRQGFVDRQGVLRHLPVDIARADVEKGAGEAPALERLQQIERADQVDLQGLCGVAKRLWNEGLPGQMDNRVRALRRKHRIQAIGLQQLGAARLQELPIRLGALRQARLQMTTDKTTEPGNQELLHANIHPRQVRRHAHAMSGDVSEKFQSR